MMNARRSNLAGVEEEQELRLFLKESLKVGDPAPDFTLPSQTGKPVALSSFKGKKWVVVYFYPKDNTPICTAESCSFRDHYQVFQEAGAEVIGISSDSSKTHSEFSSKHRLPFILLSDEGGLVRRRYGVPATFGIFPGRVTYVIDPEGKIRHIFSSQFSAEAHVERALAIINAAASNAGERM